MSFSLSTSGAVEEIDAKLDEFAAQYKAAVALTEASVESLDHAVAAAKVLAGGGVFGQQVSVTISGHANPGHAPTAGWANDFAQISVVSQDKP